MRTAGIAVVVLSVGLSCGGASAQRVAPHAHRALTAAPGGYAWYVRGELLMARGDHAGAAAAFEMARGQAEQRGGNAMAVTAHALRLGGPEDPLLLARMAEALELSGKREAADETLAEARASGPTSMAVALADARIATGRGEPQAAIAVLQRAVQLHPRSERPAHALAAALREAGHAERARDVLARLLSHQHAQGQPAGAVALRVALAEGDTRTLSAAARRALSSPLSDRDVLHATAARLLGDGAVSVALEVLRSVPEGRVDPALMLEALLQGERLAAAEAWLVEHPAEALGGLLVAAEAQLRVGRPLRAAQLCELRLSTHPDDRAAGLLAARIELSQGRPADAAARAAALPNAVRAGSRARHVLDQSLRQGGLGGLAAELGAQ